MKSNIAAAAILALGLIVAAFLYSGRYYLLKIDGGTVARLDRWTGEATACKLPASGGPASCETKRDWWEPYEGTPANSN